MDLGERSYCFDKNADVAVRHEKRHKLTRSKVKTSSRHSKARKNRRSNREGVKARSSKIREDDLMSTDTASQMRTSVSASTLFSQKRSRTDKSSRLRSGRRRKGHVQKISSAVGDGSSSSTKSPVAPIPQKSARFLSPLLGAQPTSRMQMEEQ